MKMSQVQNDDDDIIPSRSRKNSFMAKYRKKVINSPLDEKYLSQPWTAIFNVMSRSPVFGSVRFNSVFVYADFATQWPREDGTIRIVLKWVPSNSEEVERKVEN